WYVCACGTSTLTAWAVTIMAPQSGAATRNDVSLNGGGGDPAPPDPGLSPTVASTCHPSRDRACYGTSWRDRASPGCPTIRPPAQQFRRARQSLGKARTKVAGDREPVARDAPAIAPRRRRFRRDRSASS